MPHGRLKRRLDRDHDSEQSVLTVQSNRSVSTERVCGCLYPTTPNTVKRRFHGFARTIVRVDERRARGHREMGFRSTAPREERVRNDNN